MCKYLLLMGNFNSKVGEHKGEKYIGKFGLWQRNESGQRLIEFVEGNKLYIMNTLFKKSESRKWSWCSPDGKVKNEIDY